MSRIVYRHDGVDTFIVGTVGAPGERTFFLQISSAAGLNTVKLEKSQVLALVARFEEMIKELSRNRLASLDELGLKLPEHKGGLIFPIEEDFQVGIIGISWTQESQRIDLEAQSMTDESVNELLSEDDVEFMEDAPDLLVASLRIAQVRNFIEMGYKLVAAGRQPCPFCGLPVDPAGHLCPRANGYRR